MAPGEARRHIKRILNMVEGIEDKIYAVNVIEDFNEFFNLKQELQNLANALSQSAELEAQNLVDDRWCSLSPSTMVAQMWQWVPSQALGSG